MAPPVSSLLYFFTLILLVQSHPNLLPSDFNALLLIHQDLGLPRPRPSNPCASPGIFCEPRTLNNSLFLRVTRIVFHSHHLSGRLSPALAKLSELKELSLSNNNLFREIPVQIANCQQLEILNLRNNRFSGDIPPGLSSLLRLRVLDVSANRFTGNLNFLKYFPNLEKLNLADNLFTGKVPVSVRSFRNLRSINISGNALLEGTVPWMMSNHHLDDQFLSPELTAQKSNPKRYIFAESSPGGKNASTAIAPQTSTHANAPTPGPTATATPPSHKHRNKKKKIITWTLGFLAGSIAGIISGIIFSMMFKLLMLLIRGRSNNTSLRIFSPMIKKPEDLAFLDKEEGLASLEVIGKGGCGEVYKASLPGNGKEIAIKKVIQPPRDAEELTEEDSKLLNKKMRQIRSEIQTVGQIRHRNLLPLLAHLPRPDCHYLVYEYMKNGSLQDYLQSVSEGKKELDWLARYKIALGVAAGLEYLHINHHPRIIHRDLKPGNILLDDEMEARIADFGLAKSVPDAHTHVTTSNIAGTVGYIAPEYYQTFKFTDKCDIYSFGVVLGALVMGKLPSDEFFQTTEEMSLVKWMRNVMTSENPTRAIDPKLLGNGHEDQMLLVLKVACFCTLDDPKERPNSKDARCMLSQIKN